MKSGQKKLILWAHAPRAAEFSCQIFDNFSKLIYSTNSLANKASEMTSFSPCEKRYTLSSLLSLWNSLRHKWGRQMQLFLILQSLYQINNENILEWTHMNDLF